MNRKILQSQTVNAGTAVRVFHLLEDRIDLETIADRVGLPIRSVERLAAAKNHLEIAGPDAPWPPDLSAAWPALSRQIKVWHARWVGERDDPSVPARLEHANALVALAGKVRDGLTAPPWINRLVDPRSWSPPLVPTPVSKPPRFSFEEGADFPYLVRHIPRLEDRLQTVRRRLRAYSDRFEELIFSAGGLLTEALPGLPAGLPTQALRDAVVVEAVNRAQYPATAPSEVKLELDRSSGAVTVRVQGRAASNLPGDVAEGVRSAFHAVVERVLNSPQLKQFRDSSDALHEAVDAARKLVLSDSVARAAIVKGSCDLCRRLPTTIR